jgi:hypothetical protein
MLLAACSSPQQTVARTVRQARGWIATVDAVTAPPLSGALPRHYVEQSCTGAADALKQAAASLTKGKDVDASVRARVAGELTQAADTAGALASAHGSSEAESLRRRLRALDQALATAG